MSAFCFPKRQGEWAEACFVAEVLRRSLGIAKPYGDSSRYDFIVDSGRRLTRVQVKSVSRADGNSFRLTLSRGGGSKTGYLPSDADMLAAYVIPCNAWYIIPIEDVARRKSIRLSPHRPSNRRYEPFLNAWSLLDSESAADRERVVYNIRMTFKQIAAELERTLDTSQSMLAAISEEQSSSRPKPDKWSKREILGHLLDSASNNHQRFTRAAVQGSLSFPAYDQDRLVELVRYRELSWEQLLGFWMGYNRFLAHVIGKLPEASADATCLIGDNPPVTLHWLAKDYVDHLKHHLNQLIPTNFATEYKPG